MAITMKAILVFVLVMSDTGTARAAQGDNKNGTSKKPVPTLENGTDSSTNATTGSLRAPAIPIYLIGPEDVLDINIWKERDVSRIVPVRPDGRISLPLINDIQAAGLSSEQLSATIAEKLRKFLTEPQVTVIVTAINSQRVFVVGEVLRVGAFPLLPGTTVLQALASASGFTTFADVRKIHVMRVRNGKPVELSFNYREVLKGDKPEQSITLEPGDTIVVP